MRESPTLLAAGPATLLDPRALRWRDEWGAAASLALHLAFLAFLIFRPGPKPPETFRPPEAIPIELVAPPEAAPPKPPGTIPLTPPGQETKTPAEIPPTPPAKEAQPPAAPPPPASAALPPPGITLGPAPPTGMIRAEKMLADQALDKPGARAAKKVLAQLDPEERRLQLCNLEAVAQIEATRSDLHPERIIGYAKGAEDVKSNEIAADGAAFKSGGKWYLLSFRCRLSNDGEHVVGLDYKIGAPIPPSEWARLGLPTD
jgi:hypothetical protein